VPHRPQEKGYIDWSVKIAMQLEEQSHKATEVPLENRGQYLEQHTMTPTDWVRYTMLVLFKCG
jgi:hypothetical protein